MRLAFAGDSKDDARSFLLVSLLWLFGCGGLIAPEDPSTDAGAGGAQTDSMTQLYAVSGTAHGLEGSSLTLLNNGVISVLLAGDGPFAFPRVLADGTRYAITVLKDPPGHVCSIEHQSGQIAGADVTDVTVNCPSTDASLVALSLSAAPLSPEFDPSTLSYTSAPAIPLLSTAFTTVTATARDPGAQITIAGAPVLSASPSTPIPLTAVPTPIDISVTAADGKTQTHYTVVLTSRYRSDYLKASHTNPGAAFGTAIALVGDTLAVGARGESSNATGINGNEADTSLQYSGAVYVFTRAGGIWSQQAYIKPSNPQVQAQFGRAVALSGDTLAVGADGESGGATGVNGNDADRSATAAGAAYVFVRTGGVWSQQAYVKASNTRARALFGSSVALFGDTLAVGSEGEASNARGVDGDQTFSTWTSAGAAYVFTRTGTVWSQQAYVKASNTDQGAGFGFSIALSADTMAVGAFLESGSSTGVNGSEISGGLTNSGAVYVFTRSSATWSQQAYVKASNTYFRAYFGFAVALSGDTLAVGAPGESSSATGMDGNGADRSATNAGAVYMFRRNGIAWAQDAYVKASNTRAEWDFGSGVALEDDVLAVGATGDTSNAIGVDGNQGDTSLLYAGAGYVFRRTGGTWSQERYVKPSNTRSYANFGSAIALSAGTLAVGSQGETSNATGVNGDQSDGAAPNTGATYIYP